MLRDCVERQETRPTEWKADGHSEEGRCRTETNRAEINQIGNPKRHLSFKYTILKQFFYNSLDSEIITELTFREAARISFIIYGIVGHSAPIIPDCLTGRSSIVCFTEDRRTAPHSPPQSRITPLRQNISRLRATPITHGSL